MSGGSESKLRRRQAEGTGSRKRQLDRIYKRDKGICQICFQVCERQDASRDHIKEAFYCTKQEMRDDNNVRLAHVECNNYRSNSPDSPEYLPGTLKQNGPSPMTQSLADKFKELGFVFEPRVIEFFDLPEDDAVAEWWWHENI